MIISNRAKEEMRASGITAEEISACLEHGTPEIKQVVKGEMRYGNKLELKDKTIIVIYTYQNEKRRVITCYPIRRKKWGNK